ncbi:MAG: tyrosine-type recombinase/integrase [Polyangiaceae bacterium]
MASTRRATGDGPEGLLVRPWENARRDLAKACEAINAPRVTWNDLRQTLSTWLVEGGVSDTAIAKLLGHADTTMLHRVYGKPRDEAVSSLLARQTSGLPPVRLPVRVVYVSPSDRALPGPKAPLASVRNVSFAVGRAGLEPATYGLKVRTPSGVLPMIWRQSGAM